MGSGSETMAQDTRQNFADRFVQFVRIDSHSAHPRIQSGQSQIRKHTIKVAVTVDHVRAVHVLHADGGSHILLVAFGTALSQAVWDPQKTSLIHFHCLHLSHICASSRILFLERHSCWNRIPHFGQAD